MSELEFLSADGARAADGFEPRYRSPLARALAGAPDGIRDVSRTGKLEVRGPVPELDSGHLIPITQHRALVLCDDDERAALRSTLAESAQVTDVTAALAGIAVHDERVVRRLTDLDLAALPAAGAVAHVPAVVVRRGGELWILFPQELSRYMADVVLDTIAGLR